MRGRRRRRLPRGSRLEETAGDDEPCRPEALKKRVFVAKEDRFRIGPDSVGRRFDENTDVAGLERHANPNTCPSPAIRAEHASGAAGGP
jgi:hypothetical protein